MNSKARHQTSIEHPRVEVSSLGEDSGTSAGKELTRALFIVGDPDVWNIEEWLRARCRSSPSPKTPNRRQSPAVLELETATMGGSPSSRWWVCSLLSSIVGAGG